jgi:hypothetical protein
VLPGLNPGSNPHTQPQIKKAPPEWERIFVCGEGGFELPTSCPQKSGGFGFAMFPSTRPDYAIAVD